jgi:pSer/pThr/pTyr-binding forkhead associated (FHA) protein
MVPGRSDILLNGSPVFIDRSSFDPTLPHDILMSISRQHALVTYDGGKYYVQDHGRDGSGSTNHTKLNGTDIYRKGRQQLKDGDRLELAHQAELTLTFKTT